MMAKIIEDMVENTNNFIFNIDGESAVETPSKPFMENTIPHQIPWPYSYCNVPEVEKNSRKTIVKLVQCIKFYKF